VDETLLLVPIYCGDRAGLVDPLARKLEELFRLRVETHPPSFDPELAFDADRGQYNSRVLLAQLLREPPLHHEAGNGAPPTRILGLTNVDLFIAVLTFVYGEAQLDDRAAVVSAYRLDSQLYGLPADRKLLFERLVKEAVHELGHTFGLLHCADYRCVMASSTYVEEIDLKDEHFCDRCLVQLRALRARPRAPVAGSGPG